MQFYLAGMIFVIILKYSLLCKWLTDIGSYETMVFIFLFSSTIAISFLGYIFYCISFFMIRDKWKYISIVGFQDDSLLKNYIFLLVYFTIFVQILNTIYLLINEFYYNDFICSLSIHLIGHLYSSCFNSLKNK
jgi:hypothetical protein